MNGRWRPSLGLVLGGALVGTLGLSFAGLVALRYLGPQIGFRAAAMILAIAITSATALLGWLLLRLLLRPIRALEAYARAQEAATPVQPPAHFGTRETAVTARRVIAMAEALRDREATIRAFTDHVTHELKTPVSAIRATVELLEDASKLSTEDRRLLREIDGARTQIEVLLAALRNSAQAREARYLGQTRLADLVPALAAEFPGLTWTTTGETIPIPIALAGLKIVLGQLVRNAMENGARQVKLSAQTVAGRLTLDVADDGTGVSAGNEGRIFQPFFTTRREVGGTGMGLSVVRNLLAAHRAEISLLPGQLLTTFRIEFHAAEQE